jgi:hypothetical protein
MTKDYTNSTDSKEARDEALELVARNAENFMVLGMIKIRSMDGEVTGEDIRIKLSECGIKPHHHNAWGALINSAIRHGILQATGEYRHMRVKSSHARRTPVYIVLPRNPLINVFDR